MHWLGYNDAVSSLNEAKTRLTLHDCMCVTDTAYDKD